MIFGSSASSADYGHALANEARRVGHRSQPYIGQAQQVFQALGCNAAQDRDEQRIGWNTGFAQDLCHGAYLSRFHANQDDSSARRPFTVFARGGGLRCRPHVTEGHQAGVDDALHQSLAHNTRANNAERPAGFE